MPLDCTYRLQTPHRAGSLAAVAGAIADAGGLIGDVETINVARTRSIREVTVEVADEAHAERIASVLEALDGVMVLWHRDRALLRHEGGKLAIVPVRPVRSLQDMRDVYTPGVARVCLALANDHALTARYTMIGRTVAVCTNGSRVLGLGAIGPVPSMPVMEGKAVFYSQCVGISAMPVLIDTDDPDEFVATVVRISPTFGGIHLEDISTPACFEIERRLIEALDQPVMHDDVHGTAVVTLAAVLAALRRAGHGPEDLCEQTVGQIGLGAAGFGIAALMKDAGVRRVHAADPDPASHARARERGLEVTDTERLLREADVVVATTGRPGLITPEMIRPGQIILALSNPYPEIDPDAAIAAGAAFASDGTSVNNVLGFPGIFRGALLAGAESITTGMKLAAARAIAELTEESELVPDALDPEVHRHVGQAVHDAALADGVAHPERAPAGL